MKLSPNPGKNLFIEVKEIKYARYPIKTHFITADDKLETIIEKYALPFLKKSDIVVLCQKIVSICQRRVVYKKDIKIGFWAKFLSKFVKKSPYGLGVKNPLKMQLAINLAGLPRILFAGFFSKLAKIFGISGVFYHLVGHQISRLDGFFGEIFPQYAEMGILGPIDCDNLCDKLKNKYGFAFVVADVNDLGGNILGKSKNLKEKEKLIAEVLKDNPAGQSDQQTPIIIIREINKK